MGLNYELLEIIATYMEGNRDFRKEGINDPGNLGRLLANDQGLKDKLERNGFDPIDAETNEVAYCIGWAAAAKNSFGDNDDDVILAIGKTLTDHEGPSG